MSIAAQIAHTTASPVSRLRVNLGYIIKGAAFTTTVMPPRLKVNTGLSADRNALVADKNIIALDAHRAAVRVASKIAG